jgi:hypothetical protein
VGVSERVSGRVSERVSGRVSERNPTTCCFPHLVEERVVVSFVVLLFGFPATKISSNVSVVLDIATRRSLDVVVVGETPVKTLVSGTESAPPDYLYPVTVVVDDAFFDRRQSGRRNWNDFSAAVHCDVDCLSSDFWKQANCDAGADADACGLHRVFVALSIVDWDAFDRPVAFAARTSDLDVNDAMTFLYKYRPYVALEHDNFYSRFH